MKAGIAIEEWKLPIFSRHLTEAGYKFTNGGKLVGENLMLYVETDRPEALRLVVLAAAREAAQLGAPNA